MSLKTTGELVKHTSTEVKSFTIKPAISETDLDEVNEIWSQVYKEELRWLPENSKGRVFDDQYHPFSIYLVAYINHKPVGLIRIIHRREYGVPVEQFVNIDGLIEERNPSIIECQRLLILSKYRATRFHLAPFGIWPAFMKASLQYCLKNSVGYTLADCFINTPTTPIKALLHIGFKETGRNFVDTELSNISESTLLMLDNRDMLKFIYSSSLPFNKYLASHDTNISY